jgi:hypothetical protein
LNGNASLYRLFDVTQAKTDVNNTKYWQDVEQQKRRQRWDYVNKPWLGNLGGVVSLKALNLINLQKKKAVASLKTGASPLPPCTGRFGVQMGLPCSHKIAEVLTADDDERTFLLKTDCHQHWWLSRTLHEENPHLGISDPPVGKEKGRPRGGDPFSSTPSVAPVSSSVAAASQPTIQPSARRVLSV